MIYAATAENAHSFAAPRQGSGGFGGQHDPMAAVMATPSLHGEFVEADGSGGNDQVVVRAIAHPIARACYWFNQHVIDAIVNGAGWCGKQLGRWFYRNIDQRVVDGAVNGSGAVANSSGTALQPVQSGKINQYGALLFGAAAIGAVVLVLVNV